MNLLEFSGSNWFQRIWGECWQLEWPSSKKLCQPIRFEILVILWTAKMWAQRLHAKTQLLNYSGSGPKVCVVWGAWGGLQTNYNTVVDAFVSISLFLCTSSYVKKIVVQHHSIQPGFIWFLILGQHRTNSNLTQPKDGLVIQGEMSIGGLTFPSRVTQHSSNVQDCLK